MALIYNLIVLSAIALVATAYPKKYQTQPSLTQVLQSPDSYQPESTQDPPQLTVSLELPREDSPQVPFYSPEPSTELKAPLDGYFGNPAQNFQLYPSIPSQELQVPTLAEWNPSNDPKLYFEIPVILNTPSNVPTNNHPKKYNKYLEEKAKPYSFKPKTEIQLVPISDVEFAQKQKSVDKLISTLAKQDNRETVEADKTQ